MLGVGLDSSKNKVNAIKQRSVLHKLSHFILIPTLRDKCHSHLTDEKNDTECMVDICLLQGQLMRAKYWQNQGRI